MKKFSIISLILFVQLFAASLLQAAPLKVVTTLPDYAYLARVIGQDAVEVRSIVEGTQDAHFVRPKPSFVEILRSADLLIATGLDLEMWLPSAVDKSGNRRIRSGEIGYVAAATGMNLKDKPVAYSHIEGGLHLYGNPHVTVSPLNIIQAADNIRIGLSRNRPQQKDQFDRNTAAFVANICQMLYGSELISIMRQQTLLDLHKSGKLLNFLAEKHYKGKPLSDYAGGWLGSLWPLRGTKIVSYHKNWLYLFDDFGLIEGGFIEPKPGIPPSPRHLAALREAMRQNNIKLVISADYFDEKTVNRVASNADAQAILLPYYVSSRPELDTWEKLMNFWVEQLCAAAHRAGLLENKNAVR
ncbi:MAG: metal ABC transporter substrate-binding protein [Candidatus Riflebacteria bacterium]|nr:metal ABC transporter substrate-binding protein [Candidatus Riflebacteria bacterium]